VCIGRPGDIVTHTLVVANQYSIGIEHDYKIKTAPAAMLRARITVERIHSGS
jgi:hypothetical protein